MRKVIPIKATVHLASEDASGDSAIIEYTKGKPVIHQGRRYQIRTNDPICDEPFTLLSRQERGLFCPNGRRQGDGSVAPSIDSIPYKLKEQRPNSMQDALCAVLESV